LTGLSHHVVVLVFVGSSDEVCIQPLLGHGGREDNDGIAVVVVIKSAAGQQDFDSSFQWLPMRGHFLTS
jgi:hypothetical protein